MAKKSQETADEKKYFVLFETDEEGIRQFQSCSDQDRSGAMLSKMCIEGKMVPALKLEVNKNAYDVFKREQWMQEHHYRIENRCIVSGQNGKARFCPIRIPNPTYTPDNGQPKTLSNSCTACPYNNKFNLLKGKTCFSTLSVTDKDGNTDSYEPVSTRDIFRIMYIPHMSGIPGHDGHIPVIHINNLKIPRIQTFKIFPAKHLLPPSQNTLPVPSP